jgi:hypothetical protein
MATYEKVKLSGAGITNSAIFASQAMETLVHATGVGSTVLDEVWLWATNEHSSQTARIELEIGSVLRMKTEIPPMTTVLLLAGHPISGTGSGAEQIKVNDSFYQGNPFLFGYVNRITP